MYVCMDTYIHICFNSTFCIFVSCFAIGFGKKNLAFLELAAGWYFISMRNLRNREANLYRPKIVVM